MTKSEQEAYDRGYEHAKTWNGCHNPYCWETKGEEWLAFQMGFKERQSDRNSEMLEALINNNYPQLSNK